MKMSRQLLSALCAALLLMLGASARAEIVPVYAQATNPEYERLRTMLQQSQTLEIFASVMNSNVRIPHRLQLVMAECKQPNAFYKPEMRAMVLCYELIELYAKGIMKDFSGASREEIANITAGALFFVMFHEMGHALVHLFNLPIVGRDEDVADALSTYFQLRHPKGYYGILGATWSFQQKQTQYSTRHFADTHSLDPQRQLNIVCWAVGSNPRAFAPLAQRVSLPAERAKRCPSEYAKLESSVRRLLGVHLVRR